MVILLSYFPAHADVDFMSVSRNDTKVRRGDSPRSRVIFTVHENFPVKVLQKKSGAYKILDFEGQRGWVEDDALTSNGRCVIVKHRVGVNVRSGPGKRHRVNFTVDYGVAFRVIEEAAGWLHVKHARGNKGWIYEKFVWGW
jgi:SH3-like domain-containing protein